MSSLISPQDGSQPVQRGCQSVNARRGRASLGLIQSPRLRRCRVPGRPPPIWIGQFRWRKSIPRHWPTPLAADCRHVAAISACAVSPVDRPRHAMRCGRLELANLSSTPPRMAATELVCTVAPASRRCAPRSPRSPSRSARRAPYPARRSEKPLPRLTGALRPLDGGIERQKIGLRGDAADQAGDLADLTSATIASWSMAVLVCCTSLTAPTTNRNNPVHWRRPRQWPAPVAHQLAPPTGLSQQCLPKL